LPCKVWPIQLAFLILLVCKIFLSTSLCEVLHHFSHDRSDCVWWCPG
jgi:hypothetical protein